MKRLSHILVLAAPLLLSMTLLVEGSADARDRPKIHGTSSSDAFSLIGNRANGGSRHHPSIRNTTSTMSGPATSLRPHLLPTLYFVSVMGGNRMCGGGRNLVVCPPTTTPAAAPALPQVTPGVVQTALRRIGVPALTARTQPEDKTLVHFATIFYTRPQPFTRTVPMLGRQVTIVATPETYTWHYGDGTTSRTTRPGAPYPATDITHLYTDAHVTVQTRVDVTYGARFRVANGAWQDIPGAVTIAGPPAPLRVAEATPVLSGSY